VSKRHIGWLTVIYMVLSLVSCTYYSPPNIPYNNLQNQVQPQQIEKLSDLDTYRIANAAQQVIPSVVGISTIRTIKETPFEEATTIEGVGSGVVVHSDGYILTNDHVVDGSTHNITVVIEDGSEFAGEVLWSDPILDLAVVKVDSEDLPAVTLGDSESLVVGEPAIAIGTPLGLQFQHTVTSGIISALNRTVEIPTERGENVMEDLIQTDASINPGNSGGPLINIVGEVVGINTVKVTSAEGMGFAIPIDVAKPIIDHFIEEGFFVTPYIGVIGFDRETAKFYKKAGAVEEGVYVAYVDANGPAFKGGIRTGDIITKIGDTKISKMLDLRKAIYSNKVNDKIAVEVFKNGKIHTFNITLEKRPT